MKVRVRVDGREYEVEVGDLGAQPVIAVVEGEKFEVWLSTDRQTDKRIGADSVSSGVGASQPSLQQPAHQSNSSVVCAPIPGVIVSVAVEAGALVTAGQELCALEAMKMKNVIRAARAGTIGAVKVRVGQTVKHREVLMEYE